VRITAGDTVFDIPRATLRFTGDVIVLDGLAPEDKRRFNEAIQKLDAMGAQSMSDETTEDCMAGRIAATVMRQLGFREPMKHPKWQVVADEVQEIINDSMETMTRVAKLNAVLD
jgi:hypothetical protein